MKRALTVLFSSLVAGSLAKLRVPKINPPGDINSYVPYHPGVDNSTYGNIDQVYATHQHVDWFVNFTNSQLEGSIIIDFTVA